jgi:sugar transferase (PEP-CTERM/EpsH1 system associated)
LAGELVMEDLLFLAHRIPYPPDKGDKIRSYHLLRYLTRRYRVYLAAFIDDPQDWQHTDTLRAMCADSFFRSLQPFAAKLRSLGGLLQGQPLTLRYYHDRDMQRWVSDTLRRHGIRRVFVFSSAMAQYVTQYGEDGLQRIIDFVDVDSDKWLQYSQSKRLPGNWVYRREAKTLLDYERHIARLFDVSLFVSRDEAKHFQALAPDVAPKIQHFNNGVDTDYFTPEGDYPSPYGADEKVLVFTGAMDYWANVDGVIWFAHEVFPEIRKQIPNASFYIVGARPAEAVKQLARQQGIVVSGRVPDVRPYLAHATAAVAPLRIARGVQNKVLEAMAMDKPVVMTPAAAEGIEAGADLQPLMAKDAVAFQTLCLELLRPNARLDMSGRARGCVLAHYNWDKNLAHVEELLEGRNGLPSTAADKILEIPEGQRGGIAK